MENLLREIYENDGVIKELQLIPIKMPKIKQLIRWLKRKFRCQKNKKLLLTTKIEGTLSTDKKNVDLPLIEKDKSLFLNTEPDKSQVLVATQNKSRVYQFENLPVPVNATLVMDKFIIRQSFKTSDKDNVNNNKSSKSNQKQSNLDTNNKEYKKNCTIWDSNLSKIYPWLEKSDDDDESIKEALLEKAANNQQAASLLADIDQEFKIATMFLANYFFILRKLICIFQLDYILFANIQQHVTIIIDAIQA
ncbi:14502_t:CDS:2 [Dentiscutata heterogama]|uniref:14502_t:CDS:1 n=1 Tax=Dentiscutata heterogama TaxID=1316150 RepID=A0ACA9KXX5_9GLOM|nr:14502_t:CDS:2 [Dentiscutata heterogama]